MGEGAVERRKWEAGGVNGPQFALRGRGEFMALFAKNMQHAANYAKRQMNFSHG